MAINLYAIFTPLILVLVAAEFVYCLVKKNGYYKFQDSMADIGTGILNQFMNLFVFYLVINFFEYLYHNVAFFKLEATTTNYIILFFLIDFLFYWFHRIGHTYHLFWAAHMPHHSSEELNYAVGLRSSITQRLFSYTFYWPAAVLGFSPEMIVPTVAFHLLLQFAPHTRVIPQFKWKWFNYIFNTPSHHRVHHGLNKKYQDKNMGGFLIIWDRLFGTYQDEEEEVYYGVTRGPKSWDPTFINFQYYKQIWDYSMQAPYLIDKIKVWFMPMSWLPRGIEKRPFEDYRPGEQKKYESVQYGGVKWYMLLQLPFSFAIMYWCIDNNSPLVFWEKLMVFLFFWTMFTAWGGLLENKSWAKSLDLIRNITMTAALYWLFTKYPDSLVFQYITYANALLVIFLSFNLKRTKTKDTVSKSNEDSKNNTKAIA
jgi:sterol desaturase/sphingolipid hydroxylase (fatty acid hydroxylase superfamily)